MVAILELGTSTVWDPTIWDPTFWDPTAWDPTVSWDVLTGISQPGILQAPPPNFGAGDVFSGILQFGILQVSSYSLWVCIRTHLF